MFLSLSVLIVAQSRGACCLFVWSASVEFHERLGHIFLLLNLRREKKRKNIVEGLRILHRLVKTVAHLPKQLYLEKLMVPVGYITK